MTGGFLAFAVGYGGSMLWFGSSAGVALASLFPEVKSVGLWLRHGWHIVIAYIAGFFAMLVIVGWSPRPALKVPPVEGPAVVAPALPHAY